MKSYLNPLPSLSIANLGEQLDSIRKAYLARIAGWVDEDGGSRDFATEINRQDDASIIGVFRDADSGELSFKLELDSDAPADSFSSEVLREVAEHIANEANAG